MLGMLGTSPTNGKDYHSLVPWAHPPRRQPQVSAFPQIGQVVAQDPDRREVQALLRNGMIITAVVPTDGPNDGLRVEAPPMPGLLTGGRISFPHGDIRNAVWEGSHPINQTDAYNAAAGSPYDSYHAHWSGGWYLWSQQGDYARVWADNSTLLIGFSGTVPETYRHVVQPAPQAGSTQRQRVPIAQTDRRPTPASPYPVSFTHPTGATFQITGSGAVLCQAASGTTMTLLANGATILIGTSGQVTVQAASGQPVEVEGQGITLSLVGGGKVNLGSLGGPAVARVGDEVSTGGVIITGSSLVNAA